LDRLQARRDGYPSPGAMGALRDPDGNLVEIVAERS
jgi:hypothetical protein